MIDTFKFIVVSTDEPPGHNSGSWSGHNDRDEAVRIAKRIGGTAFRVNVARNINGHIISFREIEKDQCV